LPPLCESALLVCLLPAPAFTAPAFDDRFQFLYFATLEAPTPPPRSTSTYPPVLADVLAAKAGK
jgi:hypothetical protein